MKTIIFAVVVASLISCHGVHAYYPEGFETVTCEYEESLEKLIEAAEDIPNYVDPWNVQMSWNMIYNARDAKTEIEAGDALASLEELQAVTSWARRIIEREYCQTRYCLKNLHDISQQASDAAIELLERMLVDMAYIIGPTSRVFGLDEEARSHRDGRRWFESVWTVQRGVSLILQLIGETELPVCDDYDGIPTSAHYPNGFCYGTPFTLNGNTADYPRYLGFQDQCAIRLTPDERGYRASSAFMRMRMKEGFSFSAQLGYRIFGDRHGQGDGMTFTMHQDPRGVKALGLTGGALGVYSESSQSSHIPPISPSLVVEMDTQNNPGYGDRGEYQIHVLLVHTGGHREHLAQESAYFHTGQESTGSLLVLYDGESSTLRVRHTSDDYFLRRPVITTHVNLASFFTGRQVFVGVTAGSWNFAVDNQDLTSFTFSQ